MIDSDLWARIDAFDFDGSKPGSFLDHLVHKTPWEPLEAELALAEYRRFLYLTETSIIQTRPSVPLFTILKLHQEDVGGAWDRYLSEIAGGGKLYSRISAPTRSARDASSYFQTQALYEQTFGAPAPAKYWPDLTVIPPNETEIARRRRTLEMAVLACLSAVALLPATIFLLGQPAIAGGVVLGLLGLCLLFMRSAARLKSRRFRFMGATRRGAR